MSHDRLVMARFRIEEEWEQTMYRFGGVRAVFRLDMRKSGAEKRIRQALAAQRFDRLLCNRFGKLNSTSVPCYAA